VALVQRVIAGAAIGLTSALAILGFDLTTASMSGGRFRPLDTLELKTYDWRLSWTAEPSTARQDLVLVEIDEYSLRNLEPNAGRWPWPRVVHSLLLDYLARAPARIVAYDVHFAEADRQLAFNFGDAVMSGAESDQAFTDAVRKSGNVLLLTDATYEGEAVGEVPVLPDAGYRLEGAPVAERKLLFPPFEPLAGAASGFGHNLVVLDPDGPLRHAVPFVRAGDRVLPSLGLAVALRAGGIDPERVQAEDGAIRLGDRRLPVTTRRVRTAAGDATYQWALINFRGPALLDDLKSRPYPKYSFFDLLYSNEQLLAGEPPDIDPAVFKDKIVFVGVTAAGLFDVFETPFAGGRMPGIQVHAAVADDVLSNRFLASAGNGVRVASVFFCAVAIGLLAAMVPAWWATAIAVAAVAVLGLAATRLFAAGSWINLSQPVLAAAMALFGGVGYQYFVEGREKRKVKRLFGQYVSKDVFEQLVAHPELARLGGQRREMTVLFSDIRGFTSVTERGQPEEIVGMLNEYFSQMVAVVFRHQGTLDKFVGDMVMALFGAPLDDPRHADHAVEAALEMVEELGRLNARWASEGRAAQLDIGIGVNTGPMIAGNIGSEAIMSYTVIGDAVNFGSRLESLNKQYGTRILISDATRQRLTGQYTLRPLGEVVVKGKTEAVAIFELVGRRTDSTPEAVPGAAQAQLRRAH
jgi:adenylate cyclase